MNDVHQLNIGSIVFGLVGLVTGVSGVILNYLNKDRYQTQVDVYKPENEELRAINARKTAEIGELDKQNDVLRAEARQKDIQIVDLKELNSKQPDFERLVGLMSNNHTAMMKKLSELTKKAMK